MFTITKRMEIAGSHRLKLPYDSPCSNLHGHNWIIEIEISASELNDDGMVIDFSFIKKVVKEKLDHKDINMVLGNINPTAENIATWIVNKLTPEILRENILAFVSKVTVQESEGNTACYIR